METCHIFVIVEEVRMIFVIFAIVVLLVDPLKRRSQYHKVFILKQIFCIVILSLLSTLNKIYLLVIFVILICRQKLFQFSGNAWYANYGTKNDNFRALQIFPEFTDRTVPYMSNLGKWHQSNYLILHKVGNISSYNNQYLQNDYINCFFSQKQDLLQMPWKIFENF